MESLKQYAVFNRFPEPAIICADGRVIYHNAAAAAVFHDIGVGVPTPAPLDQCGLGTACSFTVQGETYAVSAVPLPEGVLLMLRTRSAARVPGLEAIGAHLRQTLGVLSASAQAMIQAGEEGEEPGTETLSRYKGALNHSIYRIIHMLEQLEKLDELANPEGTLYRPGALDLAGLCAEVMRGVEGVAALAHVQVSYESKLASLITTGDAPLLTRMLLALISNAMKATPPEGRMGVRLAQSGNRAVITVWDEGGGLQGEDLSAFFAGAPVGLPKAGAGLGIGLSIVQRVVALHRGTVMVDGRAGEGLRVTVSLPIVPPVEMVFRSPASLPDDGGFSPLLIQLADALPWRAFLPKDVD